jgi:hypothetical protein
MFSGKKKHDCYFHGLLSLVLNLHRSLDRHSYIIGSFATTGWHVLLVETLNLHKLTNYEERFWRPRWFASFFETFFLTISFFETLFCNGWRQLMYLYYVLLLVRLIYMVLIVKKRRHKLLIIYSSNSLVQFNRFSRKTLTTNLST